MLAKFSALDQLTSLRFFAAIAVFLSHLSFLNESENSLRRLSQTVFYEGYCGVTFFFALSGFILSYTYQSRFSEGTVSIREYISLRIARVYPLHILCLLPLLIFQVYKNPPQLLEFSLANLFLLQAWVPSSKFYFSLNAVSWSLSCEIFFYLCFVFYVRLKTKLLVQILIALFLSMLALAVTLGSNTDADFYSGHGLTFNHWLFYISPASRTLDFLLGVLIYRSKLNSRSLRMPSVHEVVSITCLVGAMYFFSSQKWSLIFRAQLLYLPFVAYFLFVFADGNGLISKFLKHPILVLLGEASFALYMIHQPIITLSVSFWRRDQRMLSPESLAFGLMVLSICLSILVYKFLEKPVHAKLRAQIKRRFS